MRTFLNPQGTGNITVCVALAIIALTPAPAASQDLPRFESQIVGGAGVMAQTYNLGCPANEIAIGFTGRAGQWINKLTLWCRPLNANGSLGTRHSVGSVGGSGGTFDFDIRCPAGQVMKGISPYIGNAFSPYIIRLGVYCRGWNGNSWGDTGELAGPAGGAGGSYRRLDCTAKRQPVIRIRGREGSYVDAIGITCDEVTPLPAAGAGTTR